MNRRTFLSDNTPPGFVEEDKSEGFIKLNADNPVWKEVMRLNNTVVVDPASDLSNPKEKENNNE